MIVLAFCFISSSSSVILNFNVEFLLQKGSQLIPSMALQGQFPLNCICIFEYLLNLLILLGSIIPWKLSDFFILFICCLLLVK
jgi:hypothetical protein